MIVAVVIAIEAIANNLKKKFCDFNGIRTQSLCVSAAVLYHLSYEDPYIGSRPICFSTNWRAPNLWVIAQMVEHCSDNAAVKVGAEVLTNIRNKTASLYE